jgi:hypothetical protein
MELKDIMLSEEDRHRNTKTECSLSYKRIVITRDWEGCGEEGG